MSLNLPNPEMYQSDIFKFGDDLILSRDLDPVYCTLYGAQLSEPQLSRLLLTYLAFYHLGFAAWLSEHEGDGYWAAMLAAAKNDTPSPLGSRWPRGSERRHFRGAKCVRAVSWLQNKYQTPEAPIRSLLNCKTEKHVIERVGKWPMFGPWAGFKVADLLERCVGHPLQFDPNMECAHDGGQVVGWELTGAAGLSKDGSHGQAPHLQHRIQASGRSRIHCRRDSACAGEASRSLPQPNPHLGGQVRSGDL